MFLFPMNYVVSSEMCSTLKPSKYIVITIHIQSYPMIHTPQDLLHVPHPLLQVNYFWNILFFICIKAISILTPKILKNLKK